MLFIDEEKEALKILKRPFGYFCGSGQKLPAQQSGIKVGNTKHLNGNYMHSHAGAWERDHRTPP
jgi:hypothetical protein